MITKDELIREISILASCLKWAYEQQQKNCKDEINPYWNGFVYELEEQLWKLGVRHTEWFIEGIKDKPYSEEPNANYSA